MDETMETPTFEGSGIDFAGTCDLAIWCKLLRDKGWSGPRIARAIAKSEGYVNNLIRVIERASPSLLLRWRAEQRGHLDHVCTTDWLVAVCILPHERQDEELQRRIATRPSQRSARIEPAGVCAGVRVDPSAGVRVDPSAGGCLEQAGDSHA